jgi:putative DNA primase/helicase
MTDVIDLSERRVREGSGERPTIEIRLGDLPRIVRQAEDALMSQGAGIYQRGGQLVRIVRLEADAKFQGVQRAAGSVVIMPVTKEYLTLALARAASWQRFDARAKELRNMNPPTLVASSLLSDVGGWRLAPLSGLTAAPTLRPDGSLLAEGGYDAASGLYGAFDPKDFPHIEPKPTREAALRSLALLEDLFSECDFSGGDKSAHAAVALASTITAVVRHALRTAPATGISAPKAGAGKTTTAKAISQLCSGRDPPVLPFSGDESEFRKFILGILIAGDACVLIDNVDKPVDSAALCAVLTSATYSDRVLGVNQKVVVPTASTWIVTGNHLEFCGDLTSRVLLSVLDPQLEHPEARAFRRDLAKHVEEHRGELLAAALSIPLAYLAAGEPATQAPRSRFAEWDRFVRRPLLWLGVADPLETQAELRTTDPVRESLLALLHAWRATFDDQAATVAAAVEAAIQTGQSARTQLLEALQGAAGERDGSINARRLGRYLVRNLRRIEGGFRLIDAGEDPLTHRRKFQVASVPGVSGVIPNPTREKECQRNGIAEKNTENACNAVKPCPACRGEGCDWCR